MLDLMNPARIRASSYYAGEAIDTLLTIMRRESAAPAVRLDAANEVLNHVLAHLPPIERVEVIRNLMASVRAHQLTREARRQAFARRRAGKAARRRKAAAADKSERPVTPASRPLAEIRLAGSSTITNQAGQ